MVKSCPSFRTHNQCLTAGFQFLRNVEKTLF